MRKSNLLTKLKNLEFRKSYVVLLVIIAVIIRFWGESSITMLQRNIPIVTDTEISQNEVNLYITTKQAYLNEKISVSRDIIVSRDLESYLDKDVHEWFLTQGWHPKRFFYVEERIKLILAYQDLREQRLGEADRLEYQANEFMATQAISGNITEKNTAAELKKQAHDIRYYINREARLAGISAEEDNIIKANRSFLEQLTEHNL